MTDARPILLWFRRDLRLSDHPALHEAAASGRPVIPVFLLDEGVRSLGAAPMMRIGMAAEALARSLDALGSRLTFRRGPAAEALATAVWPGMHHAVLSVPDARKGEQLVLLTTQEGASARALVAEARARGVPEIQVPRVVHTVTSVPMLGSGKTDYPAAQRSLEGLETVGKPALAVSG